MIIRPVGEEARLGELGGGLGVMASKALLGGVYGRMCRESTCPPGVSDLISYEPEFRVGPTSLS